MPIKNQYHQKLLVEIDKLKSKSSESETKWVQRYLGTDKIFYNFSAKQLVDLVKNFIKESNLSLDKTIELLNSLYQYGTTYNEIAIAGKMVSFSKINTQNFDPKNLDLWLKYTHGWAENDVLCQSNFTADILLSNWDSWQNILKQFNKSQNINKCRASLVLLTKSLGQSSDSRLSKLAFENVENLKLEKDILITKAVSWILRSLVKFHQPEVLDYLEKNKNSLPKIAYREALSKAITGRKYNNSKKKN